MHAEVCKRGINGDKITKKKLGEFLSKFDFYHKHESYSDPKMETTRFSINHQVTKPVAFLADLSKGGKSYLGNSLITDEHIEDACVLIVSIRRGTVSTTSPVEGQQSGELLFEELRKILKDYFGKEESTPGKRLKAINQRTFIINYIVDATGVVKKTETDGVCLHKRVAGRESSVWYKFLPNNEKRW